MVKESQGKSKYQGAKVNRDAEKSLKCFMQTAYNSSKKIFLLVLLADYLCLHFEICSAAFVSSAIESQH